MTAVSKPRCSDCLERVPVFDGAATLRYRISTLFPAIAHGDEKHRQWLKDAIDAHFAGKPVPAPY